MSQNFGTEDMKPSSPSEEDDLIDFSADKLDLISFSSNEIDLIGITSSEHDLRLFPSREEIGWDERTFGHILDEPEGEGNISAATLDEHDEDDLATLEAALAQTSGGTIWHGTAEQRTQWRKEELQRQEDQRLEEPRRRRGEAFLRLLTLGKIRNLESESDDVGYDGDDEKSSDDDDGHDSD